MAISPINPIEAIALDSTGALIAGSLGDYVTESYNHTHTENLVHPTLSNGIDVISANVNWTLGNFAMIVAANGIAAEYHPVLVYIEACDQNAVIELVLYQGGGDAEIGRIRFAVVGGFWGNAAYEIDTPHVAANARIRAKVASSNGGGAIATVRMSIGYHLA